MSTSRALFRLACAAVFPFICTLSLSAALTITPTTWNVIGLDSNDPTAGPNRFPVGARVCSDVSTTNVTVNFVWDSPNPFVDLRAGSLSTLAFDTIPAGGCVDAYFEVEVQKTAAAFDTSRRYHIAATDSSGSISTPTPRELYVEYLISQSRNAITDVRVGPDPGNLTSVPAGGSMALVVGNTYTIQLAGGTATQGYNQFEAFINFSNTVFQILDVETTYSANTSPWVSGPAPAIHEYLYADACGWENDPNSPNYLSCVGGDYKAGGSNVVTTYTIKVIGGGGSSETLGTLLYDFSGSSYHYNADYGTGARIANVIDPTAATIAKSFSPNPAPLDGTSVLSITLTNPNAGTVSGYNFVDTFPADLQVASTPGVATSGCGTPSVVATPGSGSISFSGGTLAANSTCVVRVNVTPTALGTLTNTTGSLFIDSVDTGKTATAALDVVAETPGTGLCGQTLARWNFPTGMSTTAPVATTANVTVAAAAGAGLSPVASTSDNTITPAGTGSWGSNGSVTTGTTLVIANNEYFEFAIDTTGVTEVAMAFDALFKTNNGPKGLAVYYGTSATPPGTSVYSNANALTVANAWSSFGPSDGLTFTTGLNPSGFTYFRIYTFNSSNVNPGADVNIDNVVFTSCGEALEPTIAKSFSPDPIAVNATSTLTFTLTNPNGAPLTGAKFIDELPAGVQVAAIPNATTTCGGTPSWSPTAGATTLSFGQTTGATIPAGSSCSVSVNVTATTAGPHSNISDFLSTTESGTASNGVATDTLTVVAPPVIDKQFATSPILAGGVSTLTFVVTNPNQDHALSGIAFTDTFPAAPGAMTVAAVPNASTSGCGTPVFSPAPGAGSIAFSGGSLAPGASCTVRVDVTAPAIGTYANTSGAVTHVVNSVTVPGNTASDALEVDPPSPSIALLKQVGTSASGPWTSTIAIDDGGQIYYRFTIENTGDVSLTNVALVDDTLDVSTCNASLSGLTLPVAVAANDDHIVTCVAGPVSVTSGLHVNTATAEGMYGGSTYTSSDVIASYATTGVTLDKTVTEPSFLASGDALHYSYLVTNSGFATLEGPVTVTDDKVAVACPDVNGVGDLDNYLDPGESVTCTATYFVTGGDVLAGSVTNTATASVDSVSSNSDSVTVSSAAAADVAILKTLDTAGPWSVGDSVQFTLSITNNGPSTATSIDVTDTPANLTITNVSGACVALPCTIASLANGANTSITVIATIDAVGSFDNVATANADEADPVPANNTDSTGNGGTADPVPSADIAIVKTLDTAGPFTVGDSVQFTLSITNNGPSTATSIDVTDTPANLTITNVSGACAALPCTIASLANGANTTITVTATIDAAAAFDNVATANGAEADPGPSNNTDSTGNGGTADPVPSADVAIVKTLETAGPWTVGDSVTYTLSITNNGPSTATSIDVTDTPSNLTITNVSGACATLPCTIASLANGANTTITVIATIDAVGSFDNVATANADEADPDPSNNIDSTGNGGTADPVPSADVAIVKTLDTAGPFTVGDSVTYTLSITNNGPSTATSIDVTDTPSNLTITNVSGACATLPCTIASLANAENTSITVTATIDAVGAFDNVATANADEADPAPENNIDDTGNGGTADPLPSADVAIVKTLDTAGPFTVGDSVTFTLSITNNGPSTATSIDVTDTPTNLTITNVSGACVALPCTIASLANGESTSITVTATIDTVGAFDNVATVNADEADPVPENNIDDTGNGGTTDPTPSADIAIVKTLDTPGPFIVGQNVQYTLTITNNGPSTATSIDITDTPTNLTITNVSGACTTLPCTLASLANGTNAVITVGATIDAEGAFDNAATASGLEPDPEPDNDSDDDGDVATLSSGEIDLSLEQSVATSSVPGASAVMASLAPAASVQTGELFSFVLTVRNLGPGTATGVTLTDPLPANFSLVAIDTTSGSCSGTSTIQCDLGTMLEGDVVTVTISGTAMSPGTLTNTASVAATESEITLVNNIATATVTAGMELVGVPTASEMVLMILAGLLALAGAARLRLT